ncbi:hypothetical protein DRN69_00045 [Candidatus Pacearchaeota archaeon]|nr:MAG: hypothetical protein DRN69_00045 [Candidatus Pacearchaeota archaeon]
MSGIENFVNKIIQGNALDVLKRLPDECIDCVITSPPYWGKRHYKDADVEWDDGWKGQLGLEETPQKFVRHLLQIFKEVKRVLKPQGNVFVVIDDTWSGGGVTDAEGVSPSVKLRKVRRKSLCLVPEMFAIGMVYKLGFILRQKIIWAKRVLDYKNREAFGNAMPSSAKDRQNHTFEYVYHFTRSEKYYYNQLRLPLKDETVGRMERARKLIMRTGLPVTSKNKYYQAIVSGGVENLGQAGIVTGRFISNKLISEGSVSFSPCLESANAPDVIQINVEPFPDAHFAVYPTTLVRFLIDIGCPEKVCSKCGRPYVREYDSVDVSDKIDWRYYGAGNGGIYSGKGVKDYESAMAQNPSDVKRRILRSISRAKVPKGLKPTCNCNSGYDHGVVLDPFLGSGTTAYVALKTGRKFVGIEISKEYCKIAEKRIKGLIVNLDKWLGKDVNEVMI